MFKSLKTGLYKKTHPLNTRNKKKAQPSFHSLTMCQQAVSYNGPNEWNALPKSLTDILTIGSFKRKLREYFLSQYSN